MRSALSTAVIAFVLARQPAYAQQIALNTEVRVIQAAPITLYPDATRVPLRVAVIDSTFVVVKDEGEWLQVRFQDAQYGDRLGYVQRRFV